MSAPEKIKVGCINGVPTGVYVVAESDASGTTMVCQHTVETYHHDQAVQDLRAKLGALVDAAESPDLDIHVHGPASVAALAKLKSAIAAAKGCE